MRFCCGKLNALLCSIFLLLAALLSGCIKSGPEIDFTGQTVTPFPLTFFAAAIDENGNPSEKFTDKVMVHRYIFSGSAYVQADGMNSKNDGIPMRLAVVNQSNKSYLLQMSGPKGSSYALLRMREGGLFRILYMAGSSSEKQLFEKAQIKFTENGDDLFFSDAKQLLAAFRLIDTSTPEGDGIAYRFATPQHEVELFNAVDAANRIVDARLGRTPPQPQPVDQGGFLLFDQGGYASSLVDQFYWNGTEHLDIPKVSAYAQGFVEQLKQTDGCRQTISDDAYAALYSRAAGGFVAGTIERFRQDQGHMSPDPFSAGARDAMQVYGPALQGNLDARLFFQRHGCSSPEARRVLDNIEAWVRNPS